MEDFFSSNLLILFFFLNLGAQKSLCVIPRFDNQEEVALVLLFCQV